MTTDQIAAEAATRIYVSKPAHASEPWTPKFAGGDAWRIEGSPCSYGYSRQQAEEICNAHNAAVADAREPWTRGFVRSLITHDLSNYDLDQLVKFHNATLSQRPTPADTKRLVELLGQARSYVARKMPHVSTPSTSALLLLERIDAAMSQGK